MSCTAMSTIKICNHTKHNYTNQCLSAECESWPHTLGKKEKKTYLVRRFLAKRQAFKSFPSAIWIIHFLFIHVHVAELLISKYGQVFIKMYQVYMIIILLNSQY